MEYTKKGETIMYGIKIEYGEYDLDVHLFNSAGDYYINIYYGTKSIYQTKESGNIYVALWKVRLEAMIKECQEWINNDGLEKRKKRINEVKKMCESFSIPYWNRENNTVAFTIHGEGYEYEDEDEDISTD